MRPTPAASRSSSSRARCTIPRQAARYELQARIDRHRRRRRRVSFCLRPLQQRHRGAQGRGAPPGPPAADDCISLLLGSRERYLEEHGTQPGTYYYTRGWIDFIDDPYKEYLQIIPRYGEEKAAYVARLIMEHYTRIAVIETPGIATLDDKRAYLETVAKFYELPLERLTGSLRFLEKLVSGPHDREFIVVEPGDELREERRFWELSGV